MTEDEIMRRAVKLSSPFGVCYKFRFNEQGQQYELAVRMSNGQIEWVRSPEEPK